MWMALVAHNALEIYRPDHGPPNLVRLGDDGIVWHIDPHHPFGVGAFGHSHAIVTVLGFPVGVLDDVAVGIRTAEAVAAFQLVKPRLEWRVRITPVVAPQRQTRGARTKGRVLYPTISTRRSRSAILSLQVMSLLLSLPLM